MTCKNIGVFISGRGSNFISVYENLDRINGDIKIVISNKNAKGLEFAKEKNIQTLVSNDFVEIEKTLKENKVDLILLLGYLKILPKSLIESYENKIINIHPSLIPSFCGKEFYGIKVHEEAIKRGVKKSGATTHFVNEITDGGAIIMQKTVDVLFEDTAESLAAKVLEIEHEIIVESTRLFCNDDLSLIGGRVKIRGEK